MHFSLLVFSFLEGFQKNASLSFFLSLSLLPRHTESLVKQFFFFFISLVEDAQYLESFFLSSNSRVTSVSSFTLIFIIYIQDRFLLRSFFSNSPTPTASHTLFVGFISLRYETWAQPTDFEFSPKHSDRYQVLERQMPASHPCKQMRYNCHHCPRRKTSLSS